MANDEKLLGPEAMASIRRQVLFGADPMPQPAPGSGKGPSASGRRGAGKQQPDDPVASSETLGSAFLEEVERSIGVRENGETRQVPAYRAVVKAQLATALKGGAIAQREILRQTGKLQAERDRRNSEERAFYIRYIEGCQKQIEMARSVGRPRPKLIPDPEDIVFGDDGSVSIKGPTDEEEYRIYAESPDLIRLMMMIGAYSERFAPYRNAETPEGRMCVASAFAHLLNKGLPPRLKIDEVRYSMATGRYERTARRKLEKMIREQYPKVGLPSRKAIMLPSFEVFMQGLEAAARERDQGGQGNG